MFKLLFDFSKHCSGFLYTKRKKAGNHIKGITMQTALFLCHCLKDDLKAAYK